MQLIKKVLERIKTCPQLDPSFAPAEIFDQVYTELIDGRENERLSFCLVRDVEKTITFNITVNWQFAEETALYVQRTVKFYLWAYGGHDLYVIGSAPIRKIIEDSFGDSGTRAFDIRIMQKVYDRPFKVHFVDHEDQLPGNLDQSAPIGGHLKGCRVGFDLGASDFKLAAIEDGEVLFTDEVPWNPVVEADPEYHWSLLQEGLKRAASHLPKVDCIGGSSAGIIQQNRVRVASLFRSVPEEKFASEVTPIFERLKKVWNVPVVVVNDGDVSALAGAMSLGENGILGLAMGSSEAVGFLNKKGQITGQLNELAFAPIDYNPDAAIDEWSQDIGLGVQYFSQQAVNKLAVRAGFEFDEAMLLPERLKVVQQHANQGSENALKIFQTIGVYLGYTVPYYARFYDFSKIMVFGRVTSGKGGELIIETAQKVLDELFAELEIQISVPDEKFRRVGQAVAAASLPPE